MLSKVLKVTNMKELYFTEEYNNTHTLIRVHVGHTRNTRESFIYIKNSHSELHAIGLGKMAERNAKVSDGFKNI